MKHFDFRALCLVAAWLACAPPVVAVGRCDRTCLEGLMDQYLTALQAHDPHGLPLAANARYTENSVRLRLGDGVWQTIDAGSVSAKTRLVIADPATSQVAYYGRATENHHSVLIGVRLKHSDGRLTEIEGLVVRQSSGIFGNFNDPPAFDAAWTQNQPAAQRSSRQQLIAAANAYFDGIQQGNGDIVPLADSCIRVENGVLTAPQPPRDGHPAVSIRESFNSKRFNYIREIRPRRIMLVDEERNTVYGIFSFQHPGNIVTHDPTFQQSLSKPDSVLVYPNTIEIAESFHLHEGKITHITALMVMLPYGQPQGWPAAGQGAF
jgi:hypothetical protein